MMPCFTSAPLRMPLSVGVDQKSSTPVQLAAGGLNSTWSWAAVIALVAFVVGTTLTILERRKRQRQREAEAMQQDYELLADTLVLLDRMEAIAVTMADFDELEKVCSRIRIAERRWPEIPFGAVIAHAQAYAGTVLSVDFVKELARNKGALDEVLRLSRRQGASVVALRSAIEAVQREIEWRGR